MIALAGTLLLAASLSTPVVEQSGSRLSLLDVPYLSQSEALCGGAAAAMVLRYWGTPGVTAEDFAPLIDRARGGIATASLEAAVRERGFDVVAAAGTEALVQAELSNGRPVIALIEDRPGTFHYVVVVGWHARAVVLHDPAKTPYVLARPDEFERRWSASGRWMIAVAPRATHAAPARVSAPEGSSSQSDGMAAVAPGGTSCDAVVADGVRLAQQKDLAGAERLLADAVYRCSGSAALRELAGVRLLQRRWPEVRDLAAAAIEVDPGDAHAWRLLATARYIGGDQRGALEAWNHVGEPVTDLVSVSGLARTTHRTVEQMLAFNRGRPLTAGAFDRAARRLAELPAAATTRLEYLPRSAGAAEVRAHVLERTLLPEGRVTWAATGLRAAASREIALGMASLGQRGERLDARWRFWPHRPAAGVALHVPGRAGVFSLEVLSERQPFTDAALADADRVMTQVRLADWASGAFRWEARGGFSRWEEGGSFGTVGGQARFDRGGTTVSADVDAWLGDSSFVAGALRAGWRSSEVRRGWVFNVTGSVETIGARAPLDLWPAGDTGHARASLLRAHPVLDNGALRVERLGRHLVQATTEAQYWWRASGVLPIGAATFVDAGRTMGRFGPGGDTRTDVDAGAGIRVGLPGRAGTLRVDAAHGLRDGRNALSVAWSP